MLLQPSNFHLCGCWLPLIQHFHHVLQCSWQSFWVQLPEKLSVAFLTEMRPVFLFTCCHTDCRCDLGNSGEAEQTSNGTPPRSMLHGGSNRPTVKTAAIRTSLLTGQSILGSYSNETVSACTTCAACTYCHIYQLT